MIRFKIEPHPLKKGNFAEFLKLSVETENDKGKLSESSLVCRFHIEPVEMANELELMLNTLMSMHLVEKRK